MTWFSRYLASSVGKKQIVAVTGLGLVGFLLAHLAGNLLIFAGPHAFNEYSHKLISNPLIYIAEAGLAAIFVVHIALTIKLTLENRAARGPVGYAVVRTRGEPSRRSFASQTMILSGLLVLVFTILHLLTFKFGAWYDVKYGDTQMRDLYRLTIEVFQKPLYVGWYLFAMLVLGAHLHHAIGSVFETFGIDHPRFTPAVLVVTRFTGWAIALGFAAIPLVVFAWFQGSRP